MDVFLSDFYLNRFRFPNYVYGEKRVFKNVYSAILRLLQG